MLIVTITIAFFVVICFLSFPKLCMKGIQQMTIVTGFVPSAMMISRTCLNGRLSTMFNRENTHSSGVDRLDNEVTLCQTNKPPFYGGFADAGTYFDGLQIVENIRSLRELCV